MCNFQPSVWQIPCDGTKHALDEDAQAKETHAPEREVITNSHITHVPKFVTISPPNPRPEQVPKSVFLQRGSARSVPSAAQCSLPQTPPNHAAHTQTRRQTYPQPRPTKPQRRSNPNARPQLISGPFPLSRADIPQKQQQRALGRKNAPTRAEARQEGKRVCVLRLLLHDSIDFAATPGRVWWGGSKARCVGAANQRARVGGGLAGVRSLVPDGCPG
jgi:hypothetical protein